MAVDALAVCIAETRCQFLHGRQLLPRKPELVVERWAIGYGATEHFIDTIAAQIAVALGVLPSHATIDIEIGMADQRDT